jgi:hypothetical protein
MATKNQKEKECDTAEAWDKYLKDHGYTCGPYYPPNPYVGPTRRLFNIGCTIGNIRISTNTVAATFPSLQDICVKIVTKMDEIERLVLDNYQQPVTPNNSPSQDYERFKENMAEGGGRELSNPISGYDFMGFGRGGFAAHGSAPFLGTQPPEVFARSAYDIGVLIGSLRAEFIQEASKISGSNLASLGPVNSLVDEIDALTKLII